MLSLKGKQAVITGGASGIGKATALLFAKQEAIVHVVDVNEESIKAVLSEIAGAKGNAVGHSCNVADQEQVRKTYNAINRIDILVNSAGVSHVGRADNTSEQDFERIYSVNVKGVYNSLHSALPLMLANKGGVIVNVASTAATVGIPDRFAYSMSKGAVYAMTMSVAKDYVGEGIRCNCVSPGRVHTPFVDGFIRKNYPGKEAEMFEKLSKTQPIGRMGTPDEIACLILYLSSDEAAFVTGTDYPIDGGFIKLNN